MFKYVCGSGVHVVGVCVCRWHHACVCVYVCVCVHVGVCVLCSHQVRIQPSACLCKRFVVLQHLHEEVCPKGVRHDAKVSPVSSDIGCPMAR